MFHKLRAANKKLTADLTQAQTMTVAANTKALEFFERAQQLEKALTVMTTKTSTLESLCRALQTECDTLRAKAAGTHDTHDKQTTGTGEQASE